MAGSSGNGRTGQRDSAPPRRLAPWLLASLLLHALLLQTPAPPAPVEAPVLPLQWRVLPMPVQTRAEPAPATQDQAPFRAPAASAPPAPPPLRWPADGEWRFRLRWQGEDGEALLRWQRSGGRYHLELQRRTATRALPGWRSEGRVDARGLRPERFEVERNGRWHLRLRLDPDRGLQDRLSWIWQAAAQARGLAPGQLLRLQVAGWNGEAQVWTLRVEVEPGRPGLRRLHRLMPADSLLEHSLWLDPWPWRLELRHDAQESWSLQREAP